MDRTLVTENGGGVVRARERAPSSSTKRVIVAYDGSDAARRALAHAAGLVGRGGTVAVVNVVDVRSVSSRLETVSDGQRATQEQLLRDAERVLATHGVETRLVRAAGDPGTEILSAAESISADVLVVGGHRRRTPHITHRSLTGRLVRNASCDVLVVH
jgi:nucleotide-binding universal stress UspA family protein